MTARVKLKRTSTANLVPAASEFLDGEVILQLADRKLLAKDSSNVVFEIGQDREVATRIYGFIYDSSLLGGGGSTPSGTQVFDIGTPVNGQHVFLETASNNESGYAGVWQYNTAGDWTRVWTIGSERPQGSILLLDTTDILYIFSIRNIFTTESSYRLADTTNLYADIFAAGKNVFPTRSEAAALTTAPAGIAYQTLKTLRFKSVDPTDEIILGNPSTMFTAFTDCVANVNNEHFSFTVSGTGAAFSSLAIGTDDAVGILRWAAGTVATNRCSIASPNFSILRLSKGLARFMARHRLPVLSDATNTYTTRIGFIDSITAESTDGVFFRYTNGVNGGRWQAVCRANGTETALDTGAAFGTAIANTFQRFFIEVNPNGTEAKFYIGDTLVATGTTNIPTASGRELGYGVYTQRSAGTASVNIADTDYISVLQVFTNRR